MSGARAVLGDRDGAARRARAPALPHRRASGGVLERRIGRLRIGRRGGTFVAGGQAPAQDARAHASLKRITAEKSGLLDDHAPARRFPLALRHLSAGAPTSQAPSHSGLNRRTISRGDVRQTRGSGTTLRPYQRSIKSVDGASPRGRLQAKGHHAECGRVSERNEKARHRHPLRLTRAR